MKKLFSILAAKLGEESAFNLTKKREKRTHKNKNRRRKTTFKTEKRRQIKFKQIGGGGNIQEGHPMNVESLCRLFATVFR